MKEHDRQDGIEVGIYQMKGVSMLRIYDNGRPVRDVPMNAPGDIQRVVDEYRLQRTGE
ncbi:MAG: hypothetical protein HYW27_04300 [Candidatus Aenigmarchaeota archaeon]|nr:hypothetical protein [Candidatus Aenigmarchaeota archaeon]